MPEPGDTGMTSVLVHGPAVLVEKAPAGELERSVTDSGRVTAEASASWSGGETAPAASVEGAAPIVSVDCAQARKERQAPLCRASARSTAQSVSPTPHAALPGFSGSTTSPESRTASARRSRSRPVCAAKSDVG